MAFPVDEIFTGPQSFGKRGSIGECDGIIWHTTEGGGVSRDDALATRRYQLTNPGSYNFIIYDGGIILTVPYLEASGGTNPFSAYWAPERYPFLKDSLPARAYRDPNGFQLNVAFSGKTSVFRAGGMPDNMIDTAARLSVWVQEQEWGADNLVHSGHMHWQRNRSDPSELVLNNIRERIGQLMAGDNPFIDIEDSIFKNDIIEMAEKGIFRVGASKKFNPKMNVTREELAAVINRALRVK